MMEKLPDLLALLLETLIPRSCITSWNIYQNKNKITCVTIGFNDSDPQISPHKYRRIIVVYVKYGMTFNNSNLTKLSE